MHQHFDITLDCTYKSKTLAYCL